MTVPDAVYRQMAELAARQQVSVERIVAAALAEQLSGWTRMEQMAERASRERFLAAIQGSGRRARPGRSALDMHFREGCENPTSGGRPVPELLSESWSQ